MTTASPLTFTTILDNSLLDSSMGSTQGLLSFMTDASKQIKTYLHDTEGKSQKKQRHKRLLHHLSQISVSSEDYIPDIMSTKNFSRMPVSPCPSLDSVGSMEDDSQRPSCLLSKSRKRNSTTESPCMVKRSKPTKRFNFNKLYEQELNSSFHSIRQTSHCRMQETANSPDPLEADIPSPSPNFDDLVDCMLTDDFISPINLNDYLSTV